MRKATRLALTLVLLFTRSGMAQVPSGFSWVNIESDQQTMPLVRNALHDTSITAIREVGVKDGFALVMTASREAGSPTPDYDLWSVYNINLSTHKTEQLVSGYGVKLLDWIGADKSELAITYYDCWECEAATLFTTLRFVAGSGWKARWPNKTQNSAYPQPGVVALMTDVGDPYDDDDVEQVFAVIPQINNGFAVGFWMHSRNTKTGKTDDDVERYSVDSATNEDRIEKLKGTDALSWERQICTESNRLIEPSIGQQSRACRRILRTPPGSQSEAK